MELLREVLLSSAPLEIRLKRLEELGQALGLTRRELHRLVQLLLK